MIKKMFSILVIIGMVFFIQCTDEPIEILDDAAVLKAGNGGGNGGGGNGGGGNGGQGGLYGDLIICLRTPDGIPIYEMIDGEHGTTPYPLPIMIDESTLEPLKVDDVYQVFDLNSEGEVIPEPGYIVEEVEFGRLNIVRAPQSVVDQALQEAKTALEQSGVTSIQTDASGRLIAIIGEEDWLVNYDDDLTNDEYNDKTIDSPRENVAIYQELMSRRLGQELSFLELKGYSDDDVLTLAFGAIAAGADKTGTMNVDEFAYMNNWLLRWESPDIPKLGPDVKNRFYYDYSGFSYDRLATYGNKYVRIALLFPDGTWHYEYQSLYNVVSWTSPNLLIDYANLANTGITGFSNAADDAIQVLEYIHESDLIEYSPYFTAGGFVNPN